MGIRFSSATQAQLRTCAGVLASSASYDDPATFADAIAGALRRLAPADLVITQFSSRSLGDVFVAEASVESLTNPQYLIEDSEGRQRMRRYCGVTWSMRHLMRGDVAAYLRGRDFEVFLGPNGVYESLGYMLDVPGAPHFASFTLFRTSRPFSPPRYNFQPVDLAAFGLLADAYVAAVQAAAIRWPAPGTRVGLAERMGRAALFFDTTGRLLDAGAAAAPLLLRAPDGGALRQAAARLVVQAAALTRRAESKSQPHDGHPTPGRVRLTGTEGDYVLTATVHDEHAGRPAGVLVEIDDVAAVPRARPSGWDRVGADALASLEAQLTPAQSAVLHLVLEARRTAEIARLRKTTSRTVRNQLSAIYAKAGVGGHAELLAYLERGVGPSAPGGR